MAKRIVIAWALALAPMFGACLSTAQAQYAPAVRQPSIYQTNYYDDDSQDPAANTQSSPGDMPAVTAPAASAPAANMGGGCPSCGGGCNACCSDQCGCCFNWDKDTWVKVGAGLRASFNSIDQNLPGAGGHTNVNFFNPDNMRLYFNGQGHKYIGFEFNTEIFDPNQTFTTPNDLAEMRLLDGIIKFQMSDLFNIWIGRMLPPSDRSNLDGPFFLNVWDYPFVSNYPQVFQGRETGAAYWGQLGGGIFKWQVGMYNGTQATATVPAFSGQNLQFAGRVVLNLLDPEPGYYNQSTYYGKKDILAIGLAGMTQKDANGTTAAPTDYFGWNVDFLFETKLANDGVFTFEGAYYNYDTHGGIDVSGLNIQEGQAGFATVAYMLPYEFGFGKMCGQFQPFVRWQEYHHDNAVDSTGQFQEGLDIGTNYIWYGHNARLTGFWGQRDVVGGGNYSLFRLGAQVQF